MVEEKPTLEGQRYFQLQEPTRNEKLAVGATSVVVAETRNVDNPRKVIILRNTSDNAAKIITVHMGQGVAVAEVGIVLKQNEAVTDSSESGYKCHQGTITAICAVADGQLSIFER